MFQQAQARVSNVVSEALDFHKDKQEEKSTKKTFPETAISGNYIAYLKIMDKQWTTAIFVKSKKPQTPVNRHL